MLWKGSNLKWLFMAFHDAGFDIHDATEDFRARTPMLLISDVQVRKKPSSHLRLGLQFFACRTFLSLRTRRQMCLSRSCKTTSYISTPWVTFAYTSQYDLQNILQVNNQFTLTRFPQMCISDKNVTDRESVKSNVCGNCFWMRQLQILKLRFLGLKRFPAMFNSVPRKHQRKLSMERRVGVRICMPSPLPLWNIFSTAISSLLSR